MKFSFILISKFLGFYYLILSNFYIYILNFQNIILILIIYDYNIDIIFLNNF